MTPEQIQKVLETIVNWGGTIATKGFEIALQRVYYLGVVNTIYCVIALVFLILTIVSAIKGIKMGDDFGFGLTVCSTIIGIVAFFAFTGFGSYALDCFLNPSWNALQLISSLVK